MNFLPAMKPVCKPAWRIAMAKMHAAVAAPAATGDGRKI